MLDIIVNNMKVQQMFPLSLSLLALYIDEVSNLKKGLVGFMSTFGKDVNANATIY